MKHYYIQTFMRLKTGQSPAPEQEVEVAIEIGAPKLFPEGDGSTRRIYDYDMGECRSRAREILDTMPEGKFRSGWTDWMPRRQRIEDVGDGESLDLVIEPLPPEPVYEDEEPEPEYLSHDDWVGAQEASLIAEGHMPAPGSEPDKPEEAMGGDYIGNAARRLEPWKRYKIKNVYNKPEFPHDAVDILQPDFEYEDWKEERVSQLWKRAPGYTK